MNSHTFYCLLFWRSFQQLIGGQGIILMVGAIFPLLHAAGRQLCRAVTLGHSKDTIAPRAKATARILGKVYLLFNGLVMFIVGCIGSTAGGIKVGRLLVDCKCAWPWLVALIIEWIFRSWRLGLPPAWGAWDRVLALYIGRLELMPIFLLFIPELWRK